MLPTPDRSTPSTGGISPHQIQMSTPPAAQDPPSTRTRLKASLVSLVKGPRSRLPSLSRSRKPPSAPPSDHFPDPDSTPAELAQQTELLLNLMDPSDQPLPVPHPSRRSPSSRSSGAISEFDSEASSDQYAELAKLSFSAWARRRDSKSSTSGSHQGPPGYVVDSGSDAGSPDPNRSNSSQVLPQTTTMEEEVLPECLLSSPLNPSSILQSNTHEGTVSGSPKPLLSSLSTSPKEEPARPGTPWNKTEELNSASPTNTIIPTRDVTFSTFKSTHSSQLIDISKDIVESDNVNQFAPETSSAALKGKDERRSERVESNQIDENVESKKFKRVIEPGDSDSDSNSEINPPVKPVGIPSLSLSLFQHLFDNRLSWNRKLSCIVTTLAINLFLPFVNGIMLGFGEIAAREFVGRYLGWGPLRDLYNYKNNKLKQDESLLINNSRSSDNDVTSLPNISSNQSRWWEGVQK